MPDKQPPFRAEPAISDPGRPVQWRNAARFRRALMAALVLGQTTIAVIALTRIMPLDAGRFADLLLVGLFAVLHGWIAVGCWTAIFGFVIRRRGGDRFSLSRRHDDGALASAPLAPTAIIIPICNEPVNQTLLGLRAVYRELERSGRLHHFDFYILSDTRDPEVWLAEQAAWQALRQELGAEARLFYRRRSVNLNYKSGNIADFLRRWGRRYRYMVVLDADSLMGGETLLRLVRLMEREPGVGIIQTSPVVARARTLFARLQQFASRVYSPLFASGLAAIQMGDAAYWGHNAIIRVDAFMKHCGLRKLRGPGLFGGSIVSHDFVEAAYMGRAGYEVWLEPSLPDSHEESPPTLEDELIRDHRWARGNLQHLWVLLTTRKLRFAHRMALANGIVSYLAAPLWLMFLIVTMNAASRPAIPGAPEPVPFGMLAPWAIGLGASTLGLLFLPRLLGIVDIVLRGQADRFGGRMKLVLSVLVETMAALVLAPVKMLAHSRSVCCALVNAPAPWAGQNRHRETEWKRAFREHRLGFALGLLWFAIASGLGEPPLMLWSLAVVIPLLLAAPASVVLGQRLPGLAFARAGLLITPESSRPGPLIREAEARIRLLPDGLGLSQVQQAVLSRPMNALHRQMARVRPEKTTADILRQCLDRGPEQLEQWQVSLLCQDRRALAVLHDAAWQSGRNTYWGLRIAALAALTRPATGERFETTDRRHASAQRPVCGTAAAPLSLDTVDCS